MMIPGGERALVKAACEAAEVAYAPYSKFKVGAALATTSGRVVTGCNIENASFGLTICAERTAIGRAISEGTMEFEAIAICAPGGATPCGACRQVLHEFSPTMSVIISDTDETIIARYHLSELFPHSFGPAQLDDFST